MKYGILKIATFDGSYERTFIPCIQFSGFSSNISFIQNDSPSKRGAMVWN